MYLKIWGMRKYWNIILERSFSVVPRLIFASKYSFCGIFEIYKICALLNRSRLKQFRTSWQCFARILTFVTIYQESSKFAKCRPNVLQTSAKCGPIVCQSSPIVGSIVCLCDMVILWSQRLFHIRHIFTRRQSLLFNLFRYDTKLSSSQ